MIVGNIGIRESIKRLTGMAEHIGREIHPHVIKPNEFARRVHDKDHFVLALLKQPKQFLLGGVDDLIRLAT